MRRGEALMRRERLPGTRWGFPSGPEEPPPGSPRAARLLAALDAAEVTSKPGSRSRSPNGNGRRRQESRKGNPSRSGPRPQAGRRDPGPAFFDRLLTGTRRRAFVPRSGGPWGEAGRGDAAASSRLLTRPRVALSVLSRYSCHCSPGEPQRQGRTDRGDSGAAARVAPFFAEAAAQRSRPADSSASLPSHA